MLCTDIAGGINKTKAMYLCALLSRIIYGVSVNSDSRPNLFAQLYYEIIQ